MFNEGDKYWTIQLEELTEENINEHPNRMISTAFWFDTEDDNTLMNLGLTFRSEEEAIEKATKLYYKLLWDKFGEQSSKYDGYTVALLHDRITIIERQNLFEKRFNTYEEAEAAIKTIGPVNLTKYVFELTGVTVYIPVHL